MRKLLTICLIALSAIVMVSLPVSCEPTEEPVPGPGPDDNVAVESVTLDRTSDTLEIGGTLTLVATVSPSNAKDKSVSWSSSDSSVATVSNGTVTAVAAGSATITATAGGKSATCVITVEKGGIPEGKLPASNEIWYVTSDNKPLSVKINNQSSQTLQSNTYKNGMGILSFSGPITTFTILSKDMNECARVTELLLPDCVEVFDTWSFYYKYSIKELRVPSALKQIQNGVCSFMGTNLERFTGNYVSEDGRCIVKDGDLYAYAPAGLSSYEIPAGVVKVLSGAFSYSKDLKSLVIPSSVEVLDDSCFNESGMESVTIPATVKSIHPYAFMACRNLKNLLGDSPYIYPDRKFLYQKDDPMRPMTLFFFAGRDDTTYEIPEGIRTLQYYAFLGCNKLESVTFPQSLVEIRGINVFEGCDNLEALYGYHTTSDHKGFVNEYKELQFLIPNISEDYVVPDDVVSLGFEVFAARPTLRSVTMGDQVTKIDDYAFAMCPSLKTVTLSANLASFGYNPFLDSPAIEAVYFRGLVPPAYSDTQPMSAPKVKFYVPSQTYWMYTTSSNWKDYWNIMEPYEYTDLPTPDFYISSDFSKDGEVTEYQKAKEGNGIDLVFMGDAYSDRQVASGQYLEDMKKCADSFFDIEPYRSFRDLFNIYFVTTVSATEGYARGGQSLGTVPGEGTVIGGNDAKCFEYALKAIKDESRMEDVLVIVSGNQDLSGIIRMCGTCYFYDPSDWTGRDYANGPAVTYFLKLDEEFQQTASVLHHESGGHGFAKLADEYFYPGYIYAMEIERVNKISPYLWFSNIDLTSDPAKVKWAPFLTDERYKNEGLGVFEGGDTFQYGVWRPSEKSIMGNSGDYFNAPSRYTIWYRIHKLAYGKSWNGTYEDFVAYDAINRTGTAGGYGTRSGLSVQRSRPAGAVGRKTAPPVFTNRTWRKAPRSTISTDNR